MSTCLHLFESQPYKIKFESSLFPAISLALESQFPQYSDLTLAVQHMTRGKPDTPRFFLNQNTRVKTPFMNCAQISSANLSEIAAKLETTNLHKTICDCK